MREFCVEASGRRDALREHGRGIRHSPVSNGYYDDDCYFNNPPDFLPNMNDDWFLSRYRQMKWVLATGEWDICLNENVKMDAIMNGKGIPHWLDIWGDRHHA